MSKFKMYVLTGSVLIIIAIVFILYATTNPQASFPWNNTITYIIYAVYGILAGTMWGLAFKHRQKK